MNWIPTHLTQDQFKAHIDMHLRKAKRGFISKIPRYKIFNYILYLLHTGCQWDQLPIDPDPKDPHKKEISPDAVAYHFRKWSKDGSLTKVWQGSVQNLKEEPDALDVSELNLDGSHTIAKKGGESVAYQGRKKAKTSNILPITDKNGNILASTNIIAGNHNDAFNLKPHLQAAFKDIKALDIHIAGAYFNADMAFDTQEARQVCFNHGLIPNIPENKRNRKTNKPGPKRLFDKEVYRHRFSSERTFAWVDKFKRLLIRFERKDAYFMGLHCMAFAMINLRYLIA